MGGAGGSQAAPPAGGSAGWAAGGLRRLGAPGGRIALFVGLGLWLVSVRLPAVVSGDGAVYLDQILQGELSARAVHLGYLLLLRGAALGAGALGLSPEAGAAGLSVVAGLASLGAAGALASRWAPTWGPLLAPLLLALHPLFAPQVGIVEVYLPQLAACLGALALWLAGRGVAAGLAFGLALLISPTSFVFAPALLLAGGGARRWIPFAAAALGVVAAGWLPHGGDLLDGPRGLLHLPPGDRSWARGLWQLGVDCVAGWGAAAPLVFASLLVAGAARRVGSRAEGSQGGWLGPWGAALSVALLAGAVNRYSDVPLALMPAALVAVAAPLGVERLWARPAGEGARRALKALLLGAALQGILADTAARHLQREEAHRGEVLTDLASAVSEADVVVGRWGDVRRAGWALWGDPWDGRLLVAGEDDAALSAALEGGSRAFWAPPWSPSPSARVRDALPAGAELRLLQGGEGPPLGYAVKGEGAR